MADRGKSLTRRNFLSHSVQAAGGTVFALSVSNVWAKSAGFHMTSPALNAAGLLAVDNTQHGVDVSPPLAWSRPAAAARQLALVFEGAVDDKPRPFVHWVVYNVPAALTGLPAALPLEPSVDLASASITQGLTGWQLPGYRGPYPRRTPQEFRFTLYALERTDKLPPALDKPTLLAAIEDQVVDVATLQVVTQRQR